MANQCVWFDIPVVDLDRAIKFYSAVLGQPIKKETFPGMTFGLLPHQGEEVGGCPSGDGKCEAVGPGAAAVFKREGTAGCGDYGGAVELAGSCCKRSIRSGRTVTRRSFWTARGTGSHCIRCEGKEGCGGM